AREGSGPSMGEVRDFADLFFEPKMPLYDARDLSDFAGRRYLAWKVADAAPRVPPLDEVRKDVVAAWKLEQARPLAEQAARALADKARTLNGDLKTLAGDKVIPIDSMTKMTPSILLGPSQIFPSRVNEITQLPQAGDGLRDALFGLAPRQ